METQLFYRPNDLATARYLEERLGSVSAYARSQTLHEGEQSSEGLSERPVPLLSSQDIARLSDEDVIAFHRNHRPFQLKRMDWRAHPILTKRHAAAAPKVLPLPPLADIGLHERATQAPLTLDNPDALIEQDGTRH